MAYYVHPVVRSKSSKWFLGFTLVLAFNSATFPQTSPKTPASERQALLALFRSTDGEHWKNTEGWLSPETLRPGEPGSECEWKGVGCDGGHVTSLHLPESGLKGRLPVELAKLQKLQRLELAGNDLEGEIPEVLFRMRQLETLDLARNHLRGSVPLYNAVLPNLKHLDLSRNYLGGNLTGLGRLRNLVSLDLSDNGFAGALPDSIRQLSNLERFNVGNNRLRGAIPAEIGKMQALQELFLFQNRFTGALPAALSQIPGLRIVSARHNRLEGTFPVAACGKSLVSLDLSFNQLSGELPATMDKCASLTDLMLGHNRFHGSLNPTTLAALTDLRTIELPANHFGGPLPASLKELTELEIVDISENEFTGGMENLGELSLVTLHADRNRISGTIPRELLSESLVSLTLSENQIDGPLPAELCDLSHLRILDLSHNQLKGGLCKSLDQLKELKILDLSHNQLSGAIPSSMGDLDRLSILVLSSNALSGPLPEKGELPVLQVLDLSSNRLSGKLPPWLTRARFVASVNLRNNAFTGGLDELGKSPFLRWVDLAGNVWQERIPERLADLQRTPAVMLPPAILQPNDLQPPRQRQETFRIGPAIPTPGQANATVTGTLSDPRGAALSNVKVDADCGVGVKTTETDGNGQYQLSLPMGRCKLKFTAAGFQTQTVEGLELQSYTSLRVDATFQVGSVDEMVEVTGNFASLGPWWNTWFTRRGAVEESGETVLQPNTHYNFYLELSGTARRDQKKGGLWTDVAGELRERLRKLLAQGIVETEFFVRVSVIGRGAVLSDKLRPAAEWSQAGWTAHDGDAGSAVLRVDLARLLQNPDGAEPEKLKTSPLALRGGAVRFAIDTRKPGCAVLAVSIWDENRLVPLDHLVRRISVGPQRNCASEITESPVPPGLYSDAAHDIAPDVSLHVFEFKLNGQTHSASFMVLRETKTCPVYTWDSDATLTDLVLNNPSFKRDLVRARLENEIDVYSSIGRQLKTAIFSEGGVKECGAASALNDLRDLANKRKVRMFARISDENDRLSIVPLGLLAMFEEGGHPVFSHDIRMIQPIARESLSPTDCVGNWTFLLPVSLEGVPTVTRADALSGDARVITTREDLIQRLSEVQPDDSPRGLVLLAHHEAGILRFSDTPGDVLPFVEINRKLPPGSIAVLSACETTNLSGSTKLVEHLNELGIDSVVAASFVVYPKFGVPFASNFSSVIANKDRPQLTLEEAFEQALSRTVDELGPITSEKRARGMSLEFVVVGNPSLKICVPTTPGNSSPPAN